MTAPSGPGAATGGAAVGKPPVDWRRRLVLTGIGAAAAIVAYIFATSFLPRWWAHRVGDLVDESTLAGVLAGLVIGAVFTLGPLLVARIAVHRHRSWRARGLLALAALLIASPNLTTLGIVLGRGNAAHAGERILDVQAPGFRWASLFGAIGGLAAFVGLQYLLTTRRSRRREVDRLRGELRTRDADKPVT